MTSTTTKPNLRGFDLLVGVGRPGTGFPAMFSVIKAPASDVICVRVLKGHLLNDQAEFLSTHGGAILTANGSLVRIQMATPEDTTNKALAEARVAQMRLLSQAGLLCNGHDGQFPVPEVKGKKVALVTSSVGLSHPDLILPALRRILADRGAIEVGIYEV